MNRYDPYKPLRPEQVRRKVKLPASITKSDQDILFQDKAKEKLEDALEQKGPKQHIVIAAPTGHGKESLIKKVGEEYVSKQLAPDDIAAYLDFDKEIARILRFKPGTAREFVAKHNKTIDDIIHILKSSAINTLSNQKVSATEHAENKFLEQQVKAIVERVPWPKYPMGLSFQYMKKEEDITSQVFIDIMDDKGRPLTVLQLEQSENGMNISVNPVHFDYTLCADTIIGHVKEITKKNIVNAGLLIQKINALQGQFNQMSAMEAEEPEEGEEDLRPELAQQKAALLMQINGMRSAVAKAMPYDYSAESKGITDNLLDYVQLKKIYQEKEEEGSILIDKMAKASDRMGAKRDTLAKIEEAIAKDPSDATLAKKKKIIEISLGKYQKIVDAFDKEIGDMTENLDAIALLIEQRSKALTKRKEEFYSLDDYILNKKQDFMARMEKGLPWFVEAVKDIAVRIYGSPAVLEQAYHETKKALEIEALDEKIAKLEQEFLKGADKGLDEESKEKLTKFYASVREEFRKRLREMECTLKAENGDLDMYLDRLKIALKCEGRDKAKVIVDKNNNGFESIGCIREGFSNSHLPNPHMHMNLGLIFDAEHGIYVFDIEHSSQYAFEKIQELMEKGSISLKDLNMLPKTEDIKLNVKIALLCDGHLAYSISENSTFNDLFRNIIRLDQNVACSDNSLSDLISFLNKEAQKRGYLPLDESALEEIAALSLRATDDSEKLTTQCNLYSKFLAEFDQKARKQGSPTITGKHVLETIVQRMDDNRIRKSIAEYMRKGIFETYISDKPMPGSVNVLAVYTSSDMFQGCGIVSRLNVVACPNDPTNDPKSKYTELEAEVAGSSFVRATVEVEGWLEAKFGLLMNYAKFHTADEQCYDGVDGDSGTCALNLAKISELAQMPVSPHYALTGSMSLKGKVQAIGGVNEKIEGAIEAFSQFDPELSKGNYVITIPESNVGDLMLRKDYVEKYIATGKLKIYPVNCFEQVVRHGLIGNPEAEIVYAKVIKRLESFKKKYEKDSKLKTK
ncbi:MAG: S16 family serine protease [Candidatus Woesearchaeota archaeon]